MQTSTQTGLPPLWVIYDHPDGYPDHFVVRQWLRSAEYGVEALASTLEEARELIPVGKVNLGRSSALDDDTIAEVWI